MKYKCKQCGQTMERESKKQWIKSYCSAAGKTVHLIPVKDLTTSEDYDIMQTQSTVEKTQ